MNDDALIREWRSGDSHADRSASDAVEAALANDRAQRGRERTVQMLSLLCVALLWPILLWCAANGVAPVVRGGYALMAAGVAVMLFSAYAYSLWDRKARPGASDSITQVRTTIELLRRQAGLMRSAAAWGAPIFVGVGLIGWWIYTERSHAGAFALWVAAAVAWLLSAVGGRSKSRELEARRARLEQVLNDLRS